MNVTHYNSGMSILKTIFSYMKTTLSYNQFIDGLQMTHYGEKIPYNEFQQWVENLGYTKEQFLKIIWKTNSDWDKILRKIASSVPSGKVPTRMMITDAFLNPDTFKPSILDYASLTVKASGQAIQKGAQIGGTALSMLVLAKVIGAGAAAYMLVKAFAKKKGLSQ